MTSPDEVERMLEQVGRVDVSPADPAFVDRLDTDLRRRHADLHRSASAMRVLVPVLAAAAMVLAVVLVATSAGLRDQDAGVADLPFTPTPTTIVEPTPPTSIVPPTTIAASPTTVPTTLAPPTTGGQATDPPTADTSTAGAPPGATPTTTVVPPADERPPPTTAPSRPSTTTAVGPRIRAAARRTDDGAVLVEWVIDRADADTVAGWRIERRTDRDRDDPMTVVVSRDPGLRRIVDRPGTGIVVYSVSALDAAGQVLGEARTGPV